MIMMQDGVEINCLPDGACCEADDCKRSPLDVEECPLGLEDCTGDCIHYVENYTKVYEGNKIKMKFEDGMIIHCPDKQQACWLMNHICVPVGKSREEAILGWEKYKEKTAYKLMMRPSWKKPMLMVYGSIDDEAFIGKKIIKYADIEES